MTIQATVVGNLGRDAEIRQTNNGMSVCNFSVAASSGYGQNKKTEWVSCALFGKRGESLQPYLTKGSKLTVFGSLSLNSFQSQSGEMKTHLNMNVSDVVLQGAGEPVQKSPDPVVTQTSTEAPLDDDIPF